MTFDIAVGIILIHEGSYSFDSNDPGGETKYGISKRSFPNLNIKDLTMDDAKKIYKDYYWDICQCDNLPDWSALIIFDAAVNQGAARAAAWAQNVSGTMVDGIVGPMTARAMFEMDPLDFLGDYAKMRHEFYTKLPHWRHYGAGWSKRLLDIVFRSVRFLDDSPPSIPLKPRP